MYVLSASTNHILNSSHVYVFKKIMNIILPCEVQIFWEGLKNVKKYPMLFWGYKVISKNKWEILSKFCGLLTISQLYTPHSGMLRIIFTDTMGNEWIMILVLFVLFLLKWFLEIFHRFTSFLPNQICQTFKFWKNRSLFSVLIFHLNLIHCATVRWYDGKNTIEFCNFKDWNL